MYNITKSYITLKYYDILTGFLRYSRHYKWNQNYSGLKADTLDIISVKKVITQSVRVFYVYKPNDFIDIKCLDT